ncbi:serine hydrolase [Kallotenue papyrolyticum]|uniref:serine hydrolase n=1 Tax=Kallotenue papyrolyticum TaxID=1325125 RepID=UPI0004929930|nr:serine hydrolase [Kallotenue papyrolyticum]
MRHRLVPLWATLLAALLPAVLHAQPQAPATVGERAINAAPPNFAIGLRWAGDDAPVSNGAAQRTWTWGPQILRSGLEPYAEAPGGQRAVWYFDKGRMEITHPDADPDSRWYVSSGLLARELISGRVQLGDQLSEQRAPAAVPVAGDDDAPIATTLTYRDLAPLVTLDGDAQRAPPRTAAPITERFTPGSGLASDPALAAYDARIGAYDAVTGHNLAAVFSAALPTDELLYLAGRPLSEPFWATLPLNRRPTEVLIQVFERRVLTYTPANPAAWRVEWGNVGRHYAAWRYGQAEDGAPLDALAALETPPELRPLAELSPAAAALVAEAGNSVGVAVLDLQRNLLYGANAADSFAMFSTAKVPIMLGVLQAAQREQRALSAHEARLLRSMIQVSSNDAASALYPSAGGPAGLNAYLRTLGLEQVRMAPAWGDSRATPQAMTRLLARLARCTILSAELCHQALELMRGVTPSQRWGVSAGAPADAAVALKNGWYPTADGWAINSVGYVKSRTARYTIAIYTRGNASMQAGIARVEAISRELATAFR